MNNQTCEFECLAFNVANQLYGIFADVPSVKLESITKTECIMRCCLAEVGSHLHIVYSNFGSYCSGNDAVD